MIIDRIDPETFIIYKDEPNTNEKSVLGVPQNRIIEIPNFVTPETAEGLIQYFEDHADAWGHMAFFGLLDMKPAQDAEELAKYNLEFGFFENLIKKCQEAIETVFGKPVRATTLHGQKWDVGGFAHPHSDNSDFDGNPSPFQTNKYVGILYLTDDYEGGELYFPEHSLELKAKAYSYFVFPGGVENIHGVKEVLSGVRHTMISFWDFADIEYPEAIRTRLEEDVIEIMRKQAKHREEWEKGDNSALDLLQYITRSK
jgi:hypothetical protein